jgi:hypothetical protein
VIAERTVIGEFKQLLGDGARLAGDERIDDAEGSCE